MVAVKSSEADQFTRERPTRVWLVLIHGSDAGLINERVQALLAAAVDDPKDPFQLVRLTGDDLVGDPGRLADEVGTIPLFGGRRAVLVEAGSKNITGAFEALISGMPPRDCTVVIEGGNLRRDAPLRQLIERHAVSAAVECTPDTADDLVRLVMREARAANIAIDDDARQVLVELLGADRLTTRSEIGKLLLYVHGKTRITSEDVEAIVADASATVQDAAIDDAFLGDFAGIEASVGRVLGEGGDSGVLLGAALRHALLLHRSRLDVDNRRPVPEVAQAASRYGLFFKRRGAFEKQLKAWTSEKLVRAIENLSEGIGRVRREPRLARPIATRVLWSLALSVRQGAA